MTIPMDLHPCGPWESLVRQAPARVRFPKRERGRDEHPGRLRLTTCRVIFEPLPAPITRGLELPLDQVGSAHVTRWPLLGLPWGPRVVCLGEGPHACSARVDDPDGWIQAIAQAREQANQAGPIDLDAVLGSLEARRPTKAQREALAQVVAGLRGFPEAYWHADDDVLLREHVRAWLHEAGLDPDPIPDAQIEGWARAAGKKLDAGATEEQVEREQLEVVVAAFQERLEAAGDVRSLHRLKATGEPTWLLLAPDEATRLATAGLDLKRVGEGPRR